MRRRYQKRGRQARLEEADQVDVDEQAHVAGEEVDDAKEIPSLTSQVNAIKLRIPHMLLTAGKGIGSVRATYGRNLATGSNDPNDYRRPEPEPDVYDGESDDDAEDVARAEETGLDRTFCPVQVPGATRRCKAHYKKPHGKSMYTHILAHFAHAVDGERAFTQFKRDGQVYNFEVCTFLLTAVSSLCRLCILYFAELNASVLRV